MTNQERILDAALTNNIYSQKEIDGFLSRGEQVPLHSMNFWKKLGYRPNRNCQPCVTVRLWKYDRNADKNTVFPSEGSRSASPYHLEDVDLFSLRPVEKISADGGERYA